MIFTVKNRVQKRSQGYISVLSTVTAVFRARDRERAGGEGLGQSWKNRWELAWVRQKGKSCKGLNYVLKILR